MSTDRKEIYKKNAIKIAIIIIASIIVSLLGEVVFNFKVLSTDKSNRGKISISMDNLTLGGFEYKDGKLVMTEDRGYIRIIHPSPYVNKFEFDYTLDKDMEVGINWYQSEELAVASAGINIVDRNNIALSRSEMFLDGPVYCLDLFFDTASKGVVIDAFSYDNTFNFSPRRMFTIAVFVAIALFLFLYGNVVEAKLEYAFLVVGFLTCLVMVFTFPFQKVSWDEAYHFKYAYNMGIGNDVVITPEVTYYGDDNEVASLMYPMTEEEFDQIEDYMDESNIYDKNDAQNKVAKSTLFPLSNIGHIASSVGMTLARILHLPLSDVYLFGKLFNMLLYIIVTFFAIKRMAIGKRILTFIALMPTPLFLASVYSYDATVNAFAFLGLSYILSELVEKDKLITWKSFFIFLFSIFIACGVKMIYAPLLLLLLLLPKEKFKDKKSLFIMKYGIFVLCIIVVIVMIVPMLLDPSTRGDSRGGATDAGAQLSFIFNDPIAYSKILIKHIVSFGVDFTIGNGIFANLAHYDLFYAEGYIPLIIAAVALTDTPNVNIGAKAKIFIATVVFIVICFIWTALYISYTPVESLSINGVQGRYFMPIVLPLLLVFNTDKIQNKIPDKVYNTLIIAIPTIVTYSMIGYKALAYCM